MLLRYFPIHLFNPHRPPCGPRQDLPRPPSCLHPGCSSHSCLSPCIRGVPLLLREVPVPGAGPTGATQPTPPTVTCLWLPATLASASFSCSLNTICSGVFAPAALPLTLRRPGTLSLPVLLLRSFQSPALASVMTEIPRGWPGTGFIQEVIPGENWEGSRAERSRLPASL